MQNALLLSDVLVLRSLDAAHEIPAALREQTSDRFAHREKGYLRRAMGAVGLPAFVGVVVPARDEEEDIERCLASLHRAASHPLLSGIVVQPVLVLDVCQDTTGERASDRRRPWAGRLRIVENSAGSVGAARRRGLQVALEAASGLPDEQVWLAMTDADSSVPHEWFVRQLAWRTRGADAVAGTVTIRDWADQPPAVRHRFLHYLRREGTGHGHPHVHGANLSFGAAAYRRAGGLPELSTSEDHALWNALSSTSATVSVGDLPVLTSARRNARAPGGFAHFLNKLGRQGR